MCKVDEVSIEASEYRVPVGTRAATIPLVRKGKMMDNISIPFRANILHGALNAAKGKHLSEKNAVLKFYLTNDI